MQRFHEIETLISMKSLLLLQKASLMASIFAINNGSFRHELLFSCNSLFSYSL